MGRFSRLGLPVLRQVAGSELELLIVQPDSFCNINCGYCYLPDRGIASRMPDNVLDAIVQRLGDHKSIAASLSLVWHAGEPLVVPIDWYDAALDKFEKIAAEREFQLVSSIQTNGTLISDTWSKFFKRRRIQIGLSIDGPDFIHDRHRVDRRGSGTLVRALNGLQHLKNHDVDFYNICVVTEESLDHADAIFEFFKENGIWRFGMNFAEIEGVNLESGVLSPDREDGVRRFLQKFTELVAMDKDNPWDWRERRGFLDCASAPPNFKLSQNSNPGAIISVSSRGHFSTYSPELLGHQVNGKPFSPWNVIQDSFCSMFSDPRFMHFSDLIRQGTDMCMSSCEYATICGGGSPSNKWFEHQRFDVAETRSCIVSLKAMADTFLINEIEARTSIIH